MCMYVTILILKRWISEKFGIGLRTALQTLNLLEKRPLPQNGLDKFGLEQEK